MLRERSRQFRFAEKPPLKSAEKKRKRLAALGYGLIVTSLGILAFDIFGLFG